MSQYERNVRSRGARPIISAAAIQGKPKEQAQFVDNIARDSGASTLPQSTSQKSQVENFFRLTQTELSQSRKRYRPSVRYKRADRGEELSFRALAHRDTGKHMSSTHLRKSADADVQPSNRDKKGRRK